MLPQEEYLSRHGLPIRAVNHTLSNGSLFFRADREKSGFDSRWVLVNSSWKEHGHHPGCYDVRVLVPVHNGMKDKSPFCHARGYPPGLQVSYEDFGTFFADFASHHKMLRPVADWAGAKMVAWEVFLFCNDALVAKSTSPVLRRHVESSIDPGLPEDERFRAYSRAVDALMVEMPNVFEGFDGQIHSHTKRSLGWLARLVNGD